MENREIKMPIDEIHPRIKYYLLDWKDKHLDEFAYLYEKDRVRDLTMEELVHMYAYVIKNDTNYMKSKLIELIEP